MPVHSSLSLGALHGVIAYVFADATQQGSAIVTNADIGKIAFRRNDASVWLLVGAFPPAWVSLSGGGSGPVVVPGPSLNVLSSAPFACSPTLEVGEFVYLEGEDLIGPADANSLATMPCIGVVFEKPTETTATLQYIGDVGGFTGLIPDTTYYISTSVPGQIQSSLPAALPGQSAVLQRIGSARNSTTLILSLDATDFVVLEG
jgi:hypothetical protein